MNRVIGLVVGAIFMFALLISPAEVLSSDTGAIYPGTVAVESVSPEDDVTWTNLDNIKTDNGVYATCSLDYPQKSYRLKARNFAFSAVPDGATILGIVVGIERKSDMANQVRDYRVQLLDAAGALVGTSLKSSTYYPTSDTVKSYGSTSTDAWSASPTAAMVKDVDFGVVLSSSCDGADYGVVSVDYIGMTVYYCVIPTVTTEPCDTITATDCLAHGTIANTGGLNCHTRGFCYKVGTTGDPTTADSKVYDNGGGSYGAGAYSKTISGLTPSTSYRVRAYAINSAGTGYGTSVTVTTLSSGFSYSCGYILGG